ncbi:MAG: hypothetical protein IPL54_11505 [Chitinophagaceae bacterium]|nr:hypothetical protein [Chitinophagaceae bacterium]
MFKPFLIFLLLFSQVSFSQTKEMKDCRIEIYLLKKSYPLYDTVTKKMIPFTPTLEDLEDTAFIKNSELVSYAVRKYSIKNKGQKRYRKQDHVAEFQYSLDQRMERLNLSVKLAKQFALVVNGQIVYGGHFLYKNVSVNPFGVNAFVNQNEINFQYGFKGQDPRTNKKILDCLRTTKRLTNINEKYGS